MLIAQTVRNVSVSLGMQFPDSSSIKSKFMRVIHRSIRVLDYTCGYVAWEASIVNGHVAAVMGKRRHVRASMTADPKNLFLYLLMQFGNVGPLQLTCFSSRSQVERTKKTELPRPYFEVPLILASPPDNVPSICISVEFIRCS